MARIRFCTDEQVSKTVVMGLRRRGVDILTVPEAGTRRARDEGRVVFTQDDDFLRLAAADTSHAGVVYATQESSMFVEWTAAAANGLPRGEEA